MPSTESSTTPSQQQSDLSRNELRRGARLREGIRRLGFMEGLDSIGDSLEWESSAMKAQEAADQTAMGNEQGEGSDVEGETDMKKTLIAGDVHFHNYLGGDSETVTTTPAPPPAPPPTVVIKDPPPAPPPPAADTSSKWLLPAVVAAALIGGGGLGALGVYFMSPEQPGFVDTDTDTDTITDVRLPE
jgi:hypothetical protein